MTLRTGSLYGTPITSYPPIPVDKAYSRTNQEILVRDTITLAAAPAADTVLALITGWETVLDIYDCFWSSAALGAGVTLSLGDATYPTALDNAVASNAAQQKQAGSAVTFGNYGKPLWALLGYASLAAAQAVAAQCTLLFTIGGAAATGVLSWRFAGERRS
jgi:hypothetical protein